MKRLLSIFLTLCLLFSTFAGTSAVAASDPLNYTDMTIRMEDGMGNAVTQLEPGDPFYLALYLSDYESEIGDIYQDSETGEITLIDTVIVSMTAFLNMDTDAFMIDDWDTPHNDMLENGGSLEYNAADGKVSLVLETDDIAGAAANISKADLDGNNGLLLRLRVVPTANVEMAASKVSVLATTDRSRTSLAMLSADPTGTATTVIVPNVENATASTPSYVLPSLSAPVLSATSNSSKGVVVKWKSVANADGYRVYRKTEGGSWGRLNQSTTSLSFTDTTAKKGTTYYYTVRAIRTVNGSAKLGSFDKTGVPGVWLTAPEVTTASATTGVKLTWNKITGASRYAVYQKVSGSWKRLGTTASTSYIHTGAKAGTLNTYTVRPYKKVGSTNLFGLYSASGYQGILMKATTVKTASASTGIKVSWTKIAGATSYRVYRKTVGGSWKAVKTSTTSLSFTDTTAKKGTSYYYTVRGQRTVNGATQRSLYKTSGVAAAWLTAPKVTSASSTKGVKLTWNKITGATGYAVYQKVSGSWKRLGTTASTSYIHTGTKAGVLNTYTVRPYKKVGSTNVYGLFSSSGYQGIWMKATTIKTASASTGVKVSWTKISGATSYRVYRKTAGGTWKAVKTSTKALTFTDTTAKKGTTYYYTVRGLRTVNGSTQLSVYTSGIKGVRK